MKEIETQALRSELGEKVVAEASADFDAPLVDHDARPASSRHSVARVKAREPEIQKRGLQSPLDSGPRSEARDRNDNKEIGGFRNKKKKAPRRDRTGGPRPSRPRLK